VRKKTGAAVHKFSVRGGRGSMEKVEGVIGERETVVGRKRNITELI
jgi:hypothetical protein